VARCRVLTTLGSVQVDGIFGAHVHCMNKYATCGVLCFCLGCICCHIADTRAAELPRMKTVTYM
jgi:hypothetical protein